MRTIQSETHYSKQTGTMRGTCAVVRYSNGQIEALTHRHDATPAPGFKAFEASTEAEALARAEAWFEGPFLPV